VARVTSKRQVTIPKEIADRFGIAEGDDLSFTAAGGAIRVERMTPEPRDLDVAERLELFDAATRRQQARQRGKRTPKPAGRGWTREELYSRGRSR
jgi:AbrB family looped-hinge helix DNA binding protein